MKQRFSRCISLLAVAMAALPAAAYSQYTRFLVELTDKHQSVYSLQQPSSYLSSRALSRRNRYLIAIDSTDLPVSPDYIDSLSRVPGIEYLSSSKWLNKVLIQVSDPAALSYLQTVSFIKSNAPIALRRYPERIPTIENKFRESIFPMVAGERISGVRQTRGVTGQINYGNSYQQIHIHQGEYLHNKNFKGQGMLIAMLDAGFLNLNTNPAFDSLRTQNRVIGGYDFVLNQAGISEADSHGANCLSIMAGNLPGKMVGSSPNASYLLLRTENAAEEFPVEEFFWSQGAEYADSSGADIISSSLGYTSFDDGAFNHPYTDRNGNTCLSTIAADLAAKKGILVCNSAGNSGGSASDEKYISCPADGDSVLAVGAIQTDLQIAGFSSWGPNAAGKIKPNVVAMGQGTVLANINGDVATGNGTSYSNPLMAGLVACLWQAFPEMTNMQIIDAVQKSADRFQSPTDRFGYGIPNFKLAYDALLQQRNENNFDAIVGTGWINAFPNPYQSTLNIFFRARTTGRVALQLFDMKGGLIEKSELQVTAEQKMQFQFKRSAQLPKGMYLVYYNDGQTKTAIKVIKL